MDKKLMKISSILVALIMVAGVIAGCSPATSTTTTTTLSTTEPTARTITDLLGNTVTIPIASKIQRAAVLHTPVVQDIYIVGAQDKLCALAPQAQKWWLLQKMDPRVASLPAPRAYPGNINMEELLKSNPDICIGMNSDAATIAKGSTIPTLQIAPPRTGTYLKYQEDEVRLFGKVFGKEADAEKYCKYLEDEFAMIKTATAAIPQDKKIKVLCALTSTSQSRPLLVYGGDSYMQEWIELAGCVNVSKDVTNPASPDSMTELTMEKMMAYNPDIILIDTGTPAALTGDPIWAQMPAVKAGKVYRIPAGMFIWNRPCSEGAAQFPEWLALTAYPNLFPNLTMQTEVKRFFKEIFNYTLSDDDANLVLHPPQ